MWNSELNFYPKIGISDFYDRLYLVPYKLKSVHFRHFFSIHETEFGIKKKTRLLLLKLRDFIHQY